MLKLWRLAIFAIPVFISLSAMSQEVDVRHALDQLVQNYGGETNLRKMDNMVQEWELTALMGNRHGTDTRSISAPNRLRVVLDYPQKSETRVLNGDNAFVVFGDAAPQKVSGMQSDAMRLQLMRLYSPLMLRQKIDSVSLVEQGEFLALSLVEYGVHVHYLINRDNWRIEKVAGSLLVNGNEIQFLTEYSDFTTIDGVLMHQKENKYAGGVNTAVLQLRKVTFDVQFDDDRFVPSVPLGGQKFSN